MDTTKVTIDLYDLNPIELCNIIRILDKQNNYFDAIKARKVEEVSNAVTEIIKEI